MDPAAFPDVRFVISAIPFLPFALQAWDDVRTRNAGIELGFWVCLGYLMQALGLLTSDACRASFISMFTVIVVPLLDGMLGAIVPAFTWFGALMSTVGVAMLESSGSLPSVCVIAMSSTIWYFVGGWFGGVQTWDPASWTWEMMAAICDVSATETAIIYVSVPVWGAGFALFLLGERWGATGWIRVALVLGGSLMVQIFGLSSSCVSGKYEKSN